MSRQPPTPADAKGVEHDGCPAGGSSAKASKCHSFTLAMGYDPTGLPPSFFFYANLSSATVANGNGFYLGCECGAARLARCE